MTRIEPPRARVITFFLLCILLALVCWFQERIRPWNAVNDVLLNHEHEQRRLAEEEIPIELYNADDRMQISRTNKLIYVHIPKTGGSSIETSFLFQDKQDRQGVIPRGHYHVNELLAQPLVDDFVVTTHIRDPCERFISAFHYARYNPKTSGIQELKTRFHIDAADTVDEYVELLNRNKSWKMLRKFFHFAPMHKWVFLKNEQNEMEFGVDVVMCQEAWVEGIWRLSEAIQLDPGRLKQRHANSHPHQETCSSLKGSTRATIYHQYAMDYCIFGYQKLGQDPRFSAPGEDHTQCSGAYWSKEDYTMRYSKCLYIVNLGATPDIDAEAFDEYEW